MQKPQCTQERRIFSSAAVCGSASWSEREMGLHRGLTTPAIQMPAYMRPALKSPCGSKLAFTPRVRRASARLQRLEHVDARAQDYGRPHQQRMAAKLADAPRAPLRGLLRRVGREPDEAAAPIKKEARAAAPTRATKPGARGGAETHPPDRALARLCEKGESRMARHIRRESSPRNACSAPKLGKQPRSTVRRDRRPKSRNLRRAAACAETRGPCRHGSSPRR